MPHTEHVSSRLTRLALLVDQLTQSLESKTLSAIEASVAIVQLDELAQVLALRVRPDSALLLSALKDLQGALIVKRDLAEAAAASLKTKAPVRSSDKAKADKTLARSLRRLGLVIATFAVASAPMAAAAKSGGMSGSAMMTMALVAGTVGGTVINPVTGNPEIIVELLSGGAVARTSTGNLILLAQTVDDTYSALQIDGTSKNYKVTTITKNSDNRVISVTIQEVGSAAPAVSQPVVTNKATEIANGQAAGPPGSSGGGGGAPFTFVSGAGDVNQYTNSVTGQPGADGSPGGGVRICFGILGCITVGKNPSAGGAGFAGGPVTANLTPINWGDISTSSPNLSGIIVSSVGGDGGDGGGGVGVNLPGASGGASGAGGAVTLNSSVNVTTTGLKAHGIFAQSRSGLGGTGGTGYLASNGGLGGAPGGGGAVNVTNSGAIATQGNYAIGIFAQSLGGGAGGGGDSYGIVGDSGGSTVGGKGGSVAVTNNGSIYTEGFDAHGIMAQSIGGSGGNAGDAGGIVALGAAGSAGGDGGTVTVINNGRIETIGAGARGIMAQSVGGGGGAGGDSGGIVAIGGSGTGGGIGDKVTVTNTGTVITSQTYAQGIFAQSIGGGGGNAGDGGALIAIGGDAGNGNVGGEVIINNSGTVSTRGAMSSAIQAQSIGGGGGEGGSTGGGPLVIGGSGGTGGDAKKVTINHSGALGTEGDDSHGIFAQSVGGGGGNGGSASSISAFAGLAIGGSGTVGGNGGDVDINLSSAGGAVIVTNGDRSRGLFAQSVGGGGGNGGFAAQVAVGYGAAAGAAIGGDGGAGGQGGLVTVDGDVAILTTGQGSQGLFAQSVGGGGGTGGGAISFNFAAGETAAASFSVALGGKGSSGGDGGEVTINSGGAITTTDKFSTGFVAQSVGGGGGAGGYSVSLSGASAGLLTASVGVGIGGSGGLGGVGKKVDADFDGTIQTFDSDALGAVIQSIGGGGGSGGYNVSGAIALSGGGALGASVGLGGTGGGGGAGGEVIGRVGGDVTTGGARSSGVVIQSVGGGGGTGGFNVSGSLASGGVVGLGVSVGLGGAGGAASDGGEVHGSVGGEIKTTGVQSTGLLVQSVGGGGGSGGFNVSGSLGIGGTVGGGIAVGLGGSAGGGGGGGYVEGNAEDYVHTTGDQSAGVIVQSLGGGGGTGGFNVSGAIGLSSTVAGAISVGLGGSGGDGGDGGEVDAYAKSIRTEGLNSVGFLAQSVGGGGGSGGFNVSGSIGGSTSSALGVAIGLGGSGGKGGSGKQVDGFVVGDVVTLKDTSAGIVAQSVGGGGGSGGFAVGGSITASGSGNASISVGLGGSGGDGGDGGVANLTLTGAVGTKGKKSDAVVAQSVGGGGGSGGLSVAAGISLSVTGAGNIGVGLGGSGGKGGDADAVTLKINDGAADPLDLLLAAVTEGDNSRGVVAQSVGGAGGSGGFNVTGGLALSSSGSGNIGVGVGGSGGDGGKAKKVIAEITGDVGTQGVDSQGVFVQSVGGGGGAGGFNISGGVAASLSQSGNIMIGIGGGGGKGGDGGIVEGFVHGDVSTSKAGSGAVTYQSLGGGGGTGAMNITGAVNLAFGPVGSAGSIGVGLGGFGGDGGDASTVTARVIGDVNGRGDRSYGILMQSVGGGGGAGGLNVTGQISAAAGGSGSLGIGLGGFGGGGGDGKKVTGTLTGNVVTTGNDAWGSLLQSVGGAGGTGGTNVTGSVAFTATGGPAVSMNAGVGGFGGDGGTGGDVEATVVGDYYTTGVNSEGLMAQSIGGSGGMGGMNITGGLSMSGSVGGTVSVGIGGAGGGGGNAGEVKLTFTGRSDTTGSNSDAITAQSVGGGGGAGGMSVGGGVSLAGSGAANIGVMLGGMGGVASNGGLVTLKVNDGVADPFGDLIAASTQQEKSNAVVAQSLGGSGGTGGISVVGGIAIAKTGAGNVGIGIGGGGGDGGNAALVIAQVTGDVSARGLESKGVFVQSAGGGGGVGGLNVSGGISVTKDFGGNVLVGLGGSGGEGGDGGEVRGFVKGDVMTNGIRAGAVTYQSVGGSGGVGALNVTGGLNIGVGDGPSGTLGVGIGGFGGGGGEADLVTASVLGDVSATGAEAYGILIQSAAGGGGAGGVNVTGGISLAKGGNGAIGFGMGGFGGGGGSAKRAFGLLDGDVRTNGESAFGAVIQSLGGAGGAGGTNVTGNLSMAFGQTASGAIGVGIGGFGGDGGNGGKAEGVVSGLYVTKGDNADGVIVQSMGGGGGIGGLNITGSIAAAGGNAGTVAIGLGGFGGDGGDSEDVILVRTGDTWTDGKNANGVTAQSIGGGGGKGGINVAAGITSSTNSSAGSFNLGIGGFGGNGGVAGDVTATVTGNVTALGHGTVTEEAAHTVSTYQLAPPKTVEVEVAAKRTIEDGSHGVMAQSVGGGGGNGAINVSAGIALSFASAGGSSRAATIGIGGFGGDGGDAGEVRLTVKGPTSDYVQLVAVGDKRYAAAAQSIGGGGGAGAINISGGLTFDGQLTLGIGGFGGNSGVGNDVWSDVTANLYASGERARGFLAQSVGGGGGAGGINISGGFQPSTTTKEPNVVFGLGGSGGAGNISGDVNARQDGQVWVDGTEAVGVLTQSVAGGGGDGGLNVSAEISLAGGNASKGFGIAAGIGGDGGAGADAGEANLTSLGDIIVNGKLKAAPVAGQDNLEATGYTGNAQGILVQSVGGGGGTGGVNVTAAVAVNGSPMALGVGGSGGSGGNGGAVTLTRGYEADVDGNEVVARALVRTFGDGSAGILVQSVGGGGGNGGFNASVVASRGNAADNTISGNLAVGGGGAGAGSGGEVDVRHAGDIVTDGKRSDGLIAQSIGGGGGNANFNIGYGVQKNATALNMAIGGATGAAGTGGHVTVNHTGTILVRGDESIGILAQSVGGGGGNAGLDMAGGLKNRNSLNVTIGREGGTGGEGGEVDVTFAGRVDTLGETKSTAILAQSIGGGGGVSSVTTVAGNVTKGKGADSETAGASVSIGLQGGLGATSDKVDVAASGVINTTGSESRGIHAQSIGGGGGVGGTAGTSLALTDQFMGLAIGGTGGLGAISDLVKVRSAAVISTKGSDSDGILAQSIGGGGGLGGMARTTQLNINSDSSTKTQRSATVSVGGDGGTGAVGGAIDVQNTGAVFTEGKSAFGIRGQSIGGGGGIGGMVLNLTVQYEGENQSADLNLGGSGGTGGAAGKVDIWNEGLIYTQGEGAAGISANSIGGGGGDAGTVMALTLGMTDKKTSRYSVNIGGNGGMGGTGGDVRVDNRIVGAYGPDSGKIITRGDKAYGILAQSIGGGGGNGSTVMFLSAILGANKEQAGGDSITAAFNLGGQGGSGNKAGAVQVFNTGLIDTTGAGAHGILAQSVGGGGGNGGLALAGNLLTGSLTNTPMITVGGFGGDGGDGGTVTVTNTGTIVTRGERANGIVAQSIGGGGGMAQFGIGLNGDYKSLLVSSTISALVGSLGGGSGGQGGDVYVNQSGAITVLGRNAQAIRAESINGGGGSIGIDMSGVVGLPGQSYIDLHGVTRRADPMIVAQAGGQDVQNSNAGKVHIVSNGVLQAGGANGVALFNQSVAGGGGSIDINLLLGSDLDTADLDAPVPLLVKVGLGGTGGHNNDGGVIDGEHTGDIVTSGDNTGGVLFQTVGGGGGRAVVDITAPTGSLLGDVTAGLGGTGGQNERGGDITRTQTGDITTSGDFGMAAIIQSIGGGGGSASIALKGAGSNTAKAVTTLGSDGGSGLDGGVVSATLSGDVATFGDHAVGLIAQSIGAGGGEIHVAGGGATAVAIGGANGAAGDGKAITLTNTGGILTEGAGSHGVLLQSIGGGGGAVFGGAPATVTASDANRGDGGEITFRQSGSVYAMGAGSTGVIVQSLGGGGGWVDGAFAGTAGGEGAGGSINLTLSGALIAYGAGSTGVFLQSQGADGAGNIRLAANASVRGGSGSGAAVRFSGGANNVFDSFGVLSSVSGLAVQTTSGNDQINNRGLMIGDIDLGSGYNNVLNASDGTFVALHSVDLRSVGGARFAGAAVSQAVGGVFTNAGDFRMGLSAPHTPIDLANGAVFANLDGQGDPAVNPWFGTRVITTVALDGDFVQTAGGRVAFDVAFGPYGSDRVNATGSVAVAGGADITLTWLENLAPITLFTAGDGVTDDGLTVRDTLAVDYSAHATAGGLTLDIKPRFDTPFLNANGRALGGHLNSAVTVGDAHGVGRLLAHLGNLQTGEEATYSAIFRELNPEPYLAPVRLQLTSANDFSGQLFNCSNLGVELNERCGWLVATKIDSEATGPQNLAVATTGERLSGGVETPGVNGWSMATAFGFEHNRIEVDGSRALQDGQSINAAFGLKRQALDGLQISTALSGGWQWMATSRQARVFELTNGRAKTESGYLQASGGVAYVVRNGRLFAEPEINISVTALHQSEFAETGLAGYGVAGASHTQVIATANPQITFGWKLKADRDSQATVYASVGGVFNSQDQIAMPYRLIGSGAGSSAAMIATAIDKQAFKVSVGARVFGNDKMSLTLGYSAVIGDKTDNRTAGLDLKMKF